MAQRAQIKTKKYLTRYAANHQTYVTMWHGEIRAYKSGSHLSFGNETKHQ
jgi:hypothetical protein